MTKGSIFLCLVVLLCSCANDSISSRDIRGTYLAEQTEHLGGEYACDANLVIHEKFGFFGLSSHADAALTFRFDGLFQFPSLTLNYDVNIEGDWSLRDSVITVEIDSASFNYNFISSTARNYTEESMVRYLRKEVDGDISNILRQRLRNAGSRQMRLLDVTDSALHVLVADTIEVDMVRENL